MGHRSCSILNQSNFPALSRKEGSSEHKTDNLNVQWPNHTNRDKPSTSSAFEIEHLTAEIARTNQLINLRGLLQAVRDYNEILVKCTSPESKFQASLEFFSCIGKYDLKCKQLTISNFETISFIVKNTIITAAYNPPNNHFNEQDLDQIFSQGSIVWLIGDLNSKHTIYTFPIKWANTQHN